MDGFLAKIVKILPDLLVYGSMAIIMLVAIWKCLRPIMRNASALRHATDMLVEGSKMHLSRPAWTDVGFLGKRLEEDWRRFLQNAEVMDVHGSPCEVEDYVNEDSAIFIPGNAALADIVPGLFTSLGILGTFIGLAAGLTDLNLNEMERSIMQIISGLALAFNTSIVGLVCSLLFNLANKAIVGHTRMTLGRFVDNFYRYGAARPADTMTQLVILQQEQVSYLRTFVEDLSLRLSGDIEHAITGALSPVRDSMDRFLTATTRQQLEGVDRIVGKFVMQMDDAMGGQIRHLGSTLTETVQQQQAVQRSLAEAAEATLSLNRDVAHVHDISKQVLTQFDRYVQDMARSRQQVDDTNAGTEVLLHEMHNATVEQARYFKLMQSQQTSLQETVRLYGEATDRFITGLEVRTESTHAAMRTVSDEMRGSAELLQGSYSGFVENIEEGLASALGLFDDNMHALTQQITGMLARIEQTMLEMPELVQDATGDKERQFSRLIEAMQDLQHSMQTASGRLGERAAKLEVS